MTQHFGEYVKPFQAIILCKPSLSAPNISEAVALLFSSAHRDSPFLPNLCIELLDILQITDLYPEFLMNITSILIHHPTAKHFGKIFHILENGTMCTRGQPTLPCLQRCQSRLQSQPWQFAWRLPAYTATSTGKKCGRQGIFNRILLFSAGLAFNTTMIIFLTVAEKWLLWYLVGV
ncbi:MAG: hypothetical protein WBB19_18675 [Desulforhopalus sp.]